jgi:hypothetical protein
LALPAGAARRILAVDGSDEILQRPSMSPCAPSDREPGCAPPAPTARRAQSRDRARIKIAAGLGQHQFAQQSRPLLRDAEGNVPATRMAHQVDGFG